MAHIVTTAVRETATGPGTGTVSLLGAASGSVAFGSVLSTGDTTYYVMDDGVQREWGLGTFTAGAPSTLARTTVYGNTSGTTSRLNFTGAVNVYIAPIAERTVTAQPDGSVLIDVIGEATTGAGVTIDGVLLKDDDVYVPSDIRVGQNTTNSPANANVSGAAISSGGVASFSASSASAAFNRVGTDGTLVNFLQDGTTEGTISISGTTTSYNGAHLSRWSQWATGQAPTTSDTTGRPACLRGTVLSNVDEMCEWIAIEWSEEVPAQFDKGGVETHPATTLHHHVLYDGTGNIGDVIDHTTEGGDIVQATIVQEANEQLNRTRVSALAGDRNWAGVFQAYDEDDIYAPHDFYVARKGDFIVRIAAGAAVELGNLLESAGDGTARPQADQDLVRVGTLGKVTATTPAAVYADGSWLCPVELF